MNINGLSIKGRNAPVKRGATKQSSSESKRNNRQSHTSPERKGMTPYASPTKPTGVSRAKVWSHEVENFFRLQEVGWRDLNEYCEVYENPKVWHNGLIKELRVKNNGYYTYWRRSRECPDGYVHRVKIFTY